MRIWSATGQLRCLLAVIGKTKTCESIVPEPGHIPLATLGRIDDALCNHFIDDLGLAIVVERLASRVERLAHDPGRAVVRGGARLLNERQNRRPPIVIRFAGGK
jgi:hypothetical protein